MTRILMIVYDKVDATSFYRASGVAPALQHTLGDNFLVDVVQWDEPAIHWQFLIKYSLVMLQRPHMPQALDLMRFMQMMSIPTWIDFDDDLFSIPDFNKHSQRYLPLRDIIIEVTKLATVVTVSTPALKEVYGQYSRNVFVVPNAFNDWIFKKRMLRPRNKLMLWRGGDSHEGDLRHYADKIDLVMKGHPNINFRFLGYNPWFLDKNLYNWETGSSLDVIVYFAAISEWSPMAIHVPLVDIPFNRAKSNIAYIEAAFAGAMTIAPNMEEWQRPGAMLYDNPSDYAAILDMVARGEVDIEGRANEAWNYIMGSLRLSLVNETRAEIIRQII